MYAIQPPLQFLVARQAPTQESPTDHEHECPTDHLTMTLIFTHSGLAADYKRKRLIMQHGMWRECWFRSSSASRCLNCLTSPSQAHPPLGRYF